MSLFINDIYDLSHIAISKIKGADYYCIISGISKSDTINLL